MENLPSGGYRPRGFSSFARMFGQMHHLAALGCPMPGRSAKLFLFDRIFNHCEREESVKSLRGKLQDGLERARRILEGMVPDSIVIMNKIFTMRPCSCGRSGNPAAGGPSNWSRASLDRRVTARTSTTRCSPVSAAAERSNPALSGKKAGGIILTKG
ncbi:MAG: hypothetical protein JW929_13230 [Anaerolineales bacterium]|nr:hypothetical protein [Anaerolineales bacterium]